MPSALNICTFLYDMGAAGDIKEHVIHDAINVDQMCVYDFLMT